MSIDMASEMMAEEGFSEGLGLDDTQLTAIDAALRLLTPLVASYNGTSRGANLNGVSDEYMRVASVASQSSGFGLLTAITGYGTSKPIRRNIKTGRVAENDDDTLEFFYAQRASGAHGGWQNGPSGFYVNPELWADVPCPCGVTTLLLGLGVVEMKTATVATTIRSRWVLGDGSETYGDPSPRNFGGKLGPIITRSNSEGPGTVAIPHIRVVQPVGPRHSSVRQNCSIRFWHDGSASGNTLGTSWMLVARIPI